MLFVNPANLVAHLEITRGSTVADFGCGGGYFCVPAAQLVGADGTVYAVDIMQSRLEATASSARHSGLNNIITVHADLEKPLVGIPATSCDWVFMGSVVHQVKERQSLLANAYRVLKTGGRLLVMEWKSGFTLFGPAQDSRVVLSDLIVMCETLGLRHERDLPAGPMHYAAVFVK